MATDPSLPPPPSHPLGIIAWKIAAVGDSSLDSSGKRLHRPIAPRQVFGEMLAN